MTLVAGSMPMSRNSSTPTSSGVSATCLITPWRSYSMLTLLLAVDGVAMAQRHELPDIGERFHGPAVDGQEHVPGLQAGGIGRSGERLAVGRLDGRVHEGDARALLLLDDRLAGDPQDAGEHEGEEDVENGARHENDHAGAVADRWQFLGGLGLAFDGPPCRRVAAGRHSRRAESKPRGTRRRPCRCATRGPGRSRWKSG